MKTALSGQERDDIIRHMLTTRAGAQQLAASLVEPLKRQVAYLSLVSKLCTERLASGATVNLVADTIDVKMPWGSEKPSKAIDRLMVFVPETSSRFVDFQLIDHLMRTSPDGGPCTEATMMSAAASLTTEGKYPRKPALVMNPIAYAGLLKADWFIRGWNPSYAHAELKAGCLGDWEGCTVLIPRVNAPTDGVLAVSRAPDLTVTSVLAVTLAAYGPEEGIVFKVESAAHLNRWPDAVRLSV